MAKWLSAALCLMALTPQWVMAEAGSGFSLNTGVATHSMVYDANSLTYESVGLSLGADYQVALNPYFSLNFDLQSSSEVTSGNISSDVTAGHGAATLGFRIWTNGTFVGFRAGSYSEALVGGGFDASAASVGYGFVAGWEGRSGFYLLANYDKADNLPLFSNSEINLTGLRLSLGYRWK